MSIQPDLPDHFAKASEKLLEAHGNITLFGLDYDGTLVDGKAFGYDQAVSLITEICKQGKTLALITARAATAVKLFIPPLNVFFNRYPQSSPAYVGAGNGTVLYKISAAGLQQVYNFGLTLSEIKQIVSVWEGYQKKHENIPLSQKGIDTFKAFYASPWEDLVPAEVLAVGLPFDGIIFTEQAKVSFVLPADESLHASVVEELQRLLGNQFSVSAGSKEICHITKRLSIDGKRAAVEAVMRQFGATVAQVATFGDMPHGNDQGLLSFPFSFTNEVAFAAHKDFDAPPYILPEDNLAPVARVHKAIKYLL